MEQYKNDPEIKKNEEFFLPDAEIELSLVICVWNTSHLLKRSIETYCNQNYPSRHWELIVIDDNSEDNVRETVEFAVGKINMRYIRLEHSFGMRGNTKAFNIGFAWARGSILAETTPETIFPENMIECMILPHKKNTNLFISVKTYNLTKEIQAIIDSVDWRLSIYNVMKIDGFFNDWTLNNFKTTHFGTHQTCSILQHNFYRAFPNGFPLYGDYGSEDPKYAERRRQEGIEDYTVMQPMAVHQWHAPWSFWGSKGKSPNTNAHGHSLSNYMNDKSGLVPEEGTSAIWDKIDGKQHDQFTEEDRIRISNELDEAVRKTGCDLI